MRPAIRVLVLAAMALGLALGVAPDLVAFELFGHNQQVPHWRDYSFEEDRPELPGAGGRTEPGHPRAGDQAESRLAANRTGQQAPPG